MGKKILTIWFMAFLSLALFTSNTPAMNNEYIAGEDFFGESPVILTVSRLHKPLADSPASVTVIDRQMIRSSGSQNIEDIFRLVPGFIVAHNPYNSNTAQVFYQGMGEGFFRQMQVFIDGRSVFIPSFGGVPWNELPILIEDIERIEITRGPNAVTYGANAFLATINIITRHAAEDYGAYGSMVHGVNSNDENSDVYFRVGNQIDDFDWRLTLGREEDDGLTNLNDNNLNNKLNFRTDVLLEHNQYLTIQAGANWNEKKRGDGSFADIFRKRSVNDSYQNITWERISEDITRTIKFSHARHRVNDAFDTLPLNQFLTDSLNDAGIPIDLTAEPDITSFLSFDRNSERLDLEAFENHQLSNTIKFNYGASIRRDTVDSFYLFNDFDEYQINTRRVFSSMEWRANADLLVDGGFMVEKTSFTDQEVSTRLSIVKDHGDHHFRSSYSTANRNPILWELFGLVQFEVPLPPIPGILPTGGTLLIPDDIGDKNIKPERIKSFEIGLLSQFYDNQLTSDIRIYQNRLEDQMDIDFNGFPVPPNPDPTVVASPDSYDIFVNRGKTEINGLELSINYSPNHKKYRLFGGASFQNVDSTPIKIERSFPERSGFFGGQFNINARHQISFLSYRISEHTMIDARGPTDPYTYMNLRYQLMIDDKQNTRFEIIGNNLRGEYDDYGNGFNQEKSYLIKFSTQM